VPETLSFSPVHEALVMARLAAEAAAATRHRSATMLQILRFMIDDSSFAMERPRDATGAPVPMTPTVGGLGGVLDRGDEGGVGGMLSPAGSGDARRVCVELSR
jgi:hypothetical protein